MPRKFSVAIVGATGAVGKEFLQLFDARKFPIGSISLLASPRSVGQSIDFQGHTVPVQATTAEAFRGVDFAFFSAGAERSREFIPHALSAGAAVVDNSSAFRMDPSVKLIVPEVNGDTLTAEDRLVANPNCTAAILLMALSPLRKLGTIRRVIVSTYQSASGAGAAAMQELLDQSEVVIRGGAPIPRVFPHPIAFNLFSHNTPINEEGANDEEAKVMAEARKILGMPDLALNVTCVRVPVLRAHSESVTVEFEGEAPALDAIRAVWQASPGVRLVDDRGANHFPMPIEASGQNDVLVGRLRCDPSEPRGVCFFVSGDQLLKGAALNAVQIAELMIERGFING